MNSNMFYVGMFDSWMWMLSTSAARLLFGFVAIAAPVSSVALLWYLWVSAPPPGATLSRAICGGLADLAVSLGALLIGAVAGTVADWAVVRQRDLRTWYEWQFLRLGFLAVSGVLPALSLELLRRRMSGFSVFSDLLRSGDQPTDHSAVLGLVGAMSTLLLISAIKLPHLGFAVFWFALFAPIGLALEVSIKAFVLPMLRGQLPSGGRRELLPVSDKSLQATKSLPVEPEQELFIAVGVLTLRDLVGVFLPLVMALPQVYNLLMVFTYIIDGLDLQVGNGALCGLVGALIFLPFFPATRRLPHEIMSIAVLLTGLLWVALVVSCFSVPTNTDLYCYFGSHC